MTDFLYCLRKKYFISVNHTSVNRLNIRFNRFVFVITILFLQLLTNRAETLPIKTYTSADGLIYEAVYRTHQDSRGFIWFLTGVGVSRFDGYRFTNYGMEDGLENPLIQNMIEDDNGVYWFGASDGNNIIGGGVYRFDSQMKFEPDAVNRGEKMFVHYKIGDSPAARDIYQLFKNRRGQIFAATSEGLFVLDDSQPKNKFSPVPLGVPARENDLFSVYAISEDADGSLWIGHQYGLTRRLPDGATVTYEIEPNGGIDTVRTLAIDRQNRLWLVSGKRGLINLNPEPIGSVNEGDRIRRKPRFQNDSQTEPPQGFARRFNILDSVADDTYFPIYCATDSAVWIGTRNAGLIKFDGAEFRFYTKENGLSDLQINEIREDSFGNLWVASNWGAMKITPHGFVSYKTADGLADDRVLGVFAGGDGAIYALNSNWRINRFDGKRFVSAAPKLPSEAGVWDSHRMMLDRAGEWWVGTKKGVFQFALTGQIENLARTQPVARLDKQSGLPFENIHGIFEDSGGDVWLSFRDDAAKGFLTRWQRASGELQSFMPADGIPADCTPSHFREDAAGNLIILCRYNTVLIRRNEKFYSYTTAELQKSGIVHRTLIDGKGRLWIATPLGGLIRFDNPASDNPKQTVYTALDGLSSSHVQYLAEDNWGKIYLVTSRGMDRLDPETGEVKHYTLADGLPAAGSGAAVRARDGALWLATSKGVARFIPEDIKPQASPPVFISNLRVAGKPQPISVLGETEIKNLTLESDGRQMQIDFYGLSLATGENLRYQYRLEGIEDWSEPSQQRTANYPNIAPGSYKFLVRAVGANGTTYGKPASIEFTVLRPVWQRWWSLLGLSVLTGLAIYALYRYRLAQLLKIERVRTRIATDLHDDLGASLSKIAILSEVVRQKVGENGANEPLQEIAGTSREMVDSMADIVWAINPQRDKLSDLIGRMRNLASEMTELCDIGLKFSAVVSDKKDWHLSTDLRREIYLIFKETLNNLVKHSACERAEIEIRLDGEEFVFTVKDDGRGFDFSAINANMGRGGNGLINMQKRARSLGGIYTVESKIGSGTTSTLRVSLKQNFGLANLFLK